MTMCAVVPLQQLHTHTPRTGIVCSVELLLVTGVAVSVLYYMTKPLI